MATITPFPEKMHQAFAALIADAVKEAAGKLGIGVTDYVLALYSGEEDPHPFRTTAGLEELHARFCVLIDQTCGRLALDELVTDADRTYLCYRIYLHNMLTSVVRLSESEAMASLQKALRRYWLSCGSVLTPARELLLLEGIRELVALKPG